MKLNKIGDLPLPYKIGGLVALLLVLICVFLVLFFPARMSQLGETWAERRGVGMANFVANAVAPALEFDDVNGAQALIDHLSNSPDAVYGAVLDGNGKLWVKTKTGEPPSLAIRATDKTTTSMRDGVLDVVAPVVARGGTNGTLLVGFSLKDLQVEVARNRNTVALVSVLLFLITLAATVFVATFLVRPIRELTRITGNIVSAGDLTQRIELHSADEVGQLAESFRQMVQKLRSIPLSMRDLVDSVVTVVDQVSQTAKAVGQGAQTVDARSRESSELMEAMLNALRDIADNVEVLHTSAEASASSNLEVGSLNDEVAAHIASMAKTVDGTGAAIAQMSAWIRQVSTNLDKLNGSIEETSLTMNEMDVSIRQVEANAKKAVSLSSVAAENAAAGVQSVQKTLQGIDRIRATSEMASTTIRTLGERISHIGKILGVINDIADQTNLLALNAAIIAAQAGEKGRAFAVVADEIKELASRVGASTQEIVTLIRTIQAESEKAVVAVDRGMDSVNEGVALGHATSEALQRITQSVHEATAMIQAIANATVEQARSSSQVTTSLHRIADSSQEINAVSQSQAKSSEQITRSAEELQGATKIVQDTTAAQRKRSQQIAQSIESINEMVRNLNAVQKEQANGAEQVLRAFRSVQEVVSGQTTSVTQLDRALGVLRGSAEGLKSAVRQFKV